MNFELLKLPDGTYPEGSPLRSLHVSVEQTAAYETPEYYPSYVWVHDPEWTYTDSRGHEHYRDGYDYPTLRPVYKVAYACGCCTDEDHEYIDHYECLGCGERVDHAGEKQERYTPRVPVLTDITVTRIIRYEEPMDLMGIEPVEVSGDGRFWELVHKPTWDEWLRLVEENNRIVREVAG